MRTGRLGYLPTISIICLPLLLWSGMIWWRNLPVQFLLQVLDHSIVEDGLLTAGLENCNLTYKVWNIHFKDLKSSMNKALHSEVVETQ